MGFGHKSADFEPPLYRLPPNLLPTIPETHTESARLLSFAPPRDEPDFRSRTFTVAGVEPRRMEAPTDPQCKAQEQRDNEGETDDDDASLPARVPPRYPLHKGNFNHLTAPQDSPDTNPSTCCNLRAI
jgi:hypothetical protein